MAGKAQAVQSGAELRDQVARLGASLGLEVQKEVTVGRRIWGAKRKGVTLELSDRQSQPIEEEGDQVDLPVILRTIDP